MKLTDNNLSVIMFLTILVKKNYIKYDFFVKRLKAKHLFSTFSQRGEQK